jgi:hypothetical protein
MAGGCGDTRARAVPLSRTPALRDAHTHMMHTCRVAATPPWPHAAPVRSLCRRRDCWGRAVSGCAPAVCARAPPQRQALRRRGCCGGGGRGKHSTQRCARARESGLAAAYLGAGGSWRGCLPLLRSRGALAAPVALSQRPFRAPALLRALALRYNTTHQQMGDSEHAPPRAVILRATRARASTRARALSGVRHFRAPFHFVVCRARCCVCACARALVSTRCCRSPPRGAVTLLPLTTLTPSVMRFALSLRSSWL